MSFIIDLRKESELFEKSGIDTVSSTYLTQVVFSGSWYDCKPLCSTEDVAVYCEKLNRDFDLWIKCLKLHGGYIP